MPFFKDIEVSLSRGIKFVLLLIPFIPLYVSPSLVFPYISGKNFLFRVLVELAASLWLLLFYINKKEWFRNSSMLMSILVFVFIVGLADLFGVNPYKSFWSNYERMEGYITILHLLLYFIVIRNIFKTQRDWKIFFGLVLSVSVLVSLFALIVPMKADTSVGLSRYAMEYGTRARSTIGNPPFLAAYLLLSVVIGILLVIKEKRYCLKYIIIAAVLLNSTVIYLTATRGALLGGIAGIMIFLLLCSIGRKSVGRNNYIKIVLMVTIVAIVVSTCVVLINDNGALNQDSVIYRFKTMFSDPSVLNRLTVWDMAITAIKERPVLGWGQENVIAIYTVNPISIVPEYLWMDRAHNVVIDWLVNAGFLGLFSYLAIFLTAVFVTKSAYTKNRINMIEGAVIVSALAAYFIQNLSLFDTVNSYMIFFALLAYIDVVESSDKRLSEQSQCSIRARKTNVAHICAVLIALLLFSVACYYLNYKPIKQSRESIRIGVSSHESFSVLLDKFEYLLSFNTFGDEDVRKRMLLASNSFLIKNNLKMAGASEFIQATAEELWKGIEFNRYNLEYYFDLIKFYIRIADYQPSYSLLAETLIKDCQRINPEFIWTYMAMADIYVLKKDYKSAFENVKMIAEMDPQNDNKQMKLVLAAILISNERLVSDTLCKIKEIRSPVNRNIALVQEPVLSVFELRMIADNYLLMNHPQQALQYYEDIVAMPEEYLEQMLKLRYLPWMADLHHIMSETYSAIGEKGEAAKEAEKAVELGWENYFD